MRVARRSFLPPDIETREGQHDDCEAERANERPIPSPTIQIREMQRAQPPGNRIARVLAGRTKGVDKRARIAVDPHTGVPSASLHVEAGLGAVDEDAEFGQIAE